MFIFKILRREKNELKNKGESPKSKSKSFVFVNVSIVKSCG